jgi:hypothetical protein
LHAPHQLQRLRRCAPDAALLEQTSSCVAWVANGANATMSACSQFSITEPALARSASTSNVDPIPQANSRMCWASSS